MSNKELKIKLFSYYAANLSIYRPGYKDLFMCPVCLNLFSRDDLNPRPPNPPKISLAHAPPKSLGGKPVALSCTDCDTRIGAECDRQVKYEKDAIDDLENKRVRKATFVSAKGRRLPIELEIDGNKVIFYNRPGMPSEQYRKRVKQISDEYASGIPPFEFSLETEGHKRELDKWLISQLYSAFLIMFRRFGYEYALNPNVEDIRRVLNDKGKAEKYKNAIITIHEKTSVGSFNPPIVGIRTTPKDQQCFFVEISSPNKKDVSRIIALPGFGENARESYDNLMNLAQNTKMHLTGILIKFSHPGNILPNQDYKGFGENLWKNTTL